MGPPHLLRAAEIRPLQAIVFWNFKCESRKHLRALFEYELILMNQLIVLFPVRNSGFSFI